MAERVHALVKAELLRWGRETIHLTVEQAAKKIGVSADRLVAWEGGFERPTIAQLKALANAYKRPLAVFYLPEPPHGFSVLTDFRRLPGESGRSPSPALALAQRIAQSRREIAIELFEDLGERATVYSLGALPRESAPQAGVRARGALGITTEIQFRWKEKYAALNGWKDAIERQGVLVFQASGVDVEEMRGFSISAAPCPVIAVNSRDAVNARVFSMLHELGHLMRGQGGLCDFEERGAEGIEAWCNAFAGEVLVPTDLLRAEPGVAAHSKDSWRDDEIEALSRRFSVSEEVVLRRLLTIGKTSAAFYRRKRAELAARTAPAESGRVPIHTKVLASAGRPYVGLVLEALHREAITLSDVSDYLDMKVTHVPKLELALGARERAF